jgi:hypothetical protein
MGVEVLTEAVSADAQLVPPLGGALRPNRALANALGVTHRAVHSLDVFAAPPPRELTPEEKLLHAIFGDAAAPAEDGGVCSPDIEITRGDQVIRHAQGTLVFTHAATGIISEVTRGTEGLPDGVESRISVTVTFPGPLCVGDELTVNGESLGRIDGFIDDGDPSPRLYCAHGASISGASSAGPLRVTRVVPTAGQHLRSRGAGPYDATTRAPTTGEIVRDEQLAFLASAGANALISEYAAQDRRAADQRARVRVNDPVEATRRRMDRVLDGIPRALGRGCGARARVA